MRMRPHKISDFIRVFGIGHWSYYKTDNSTLINHTTKQTAAKTRNQKSERDRIAIGAQSHISHQHLGRDLAKMHRVDDNNHHNLSQSESRIHTVAVR